MRLLIWSDTFYPHIGGVEVMGAYFVRALQARGHEVTIVAGPYQRDLPDPQDFHGIPLYRFPFIYHTRALGAADIIAMKRELATLLATVRPQVFHFYQTARAFILHMHAVKRFPAPVLLTLHGHYWSEVPAIVEARRQLVAQADWTTACSRYLLDDAQAVVPAIRQRSSVIYNSLTMPEVAPSPLDFAQPHILYVGRMVDDKGPDLALEAFAHVHKRLPHARISFAGDGVLEAQLRARAKQLGLLAAVDFLGWTSPYAIPELINQATVMLVPSRQEAFGLVALQAGQMARPVVATRVGGLPEVVVDGETGLLVASEDAVGMAAALEQLLTNPARAEAMGMAARRHVERRFGWDEFVDNYEELYARLIAAQGNPG